MRRVSFVTATLALAASAAAPAPGAEGPGFDARAYAPYARSGPYEIQSSLAISLPGDQTRSKAGVVVSAYPDLPFTRYWLRSSAQTIADRGHGSSEFDDVPPPPQLARFRHTATTAPDGAFVIRGLTAGSWVVRGRLSIAFPRHVRVLRATQAGSQDGVPVEAEQVVDETVNDFTYVWLDATAIGVGKHFDPQVYFHVVARRNKIGRA